MSTSDIEKMTAAAELRAARTKLERLRRDATVGPWNFEVEGTGESRVYRNYEFFGDQRELVAAGGMNSDDAELIVALHETIAAQLAILSAALVAEAEAAEHWADLGRTNLRGPAEIVPVNRAALDLARAINGGSGS